MANHFCSSQSFLLRVDKNTVVPLTLVLRKDHVEWMKDIYLQQVLACLRPRLTLHFTGTTTTLAPLHKSLMETAPTGATFAEWLQVERTLHCAYYFYDTPSHYHLLYREQPESVLVSWRVMRKSLMLVIAPCDVDNYKPPEMPSFHYFKETPVMMQEQHGHKRPLPTGQSTLPNLLLANKRKATLAIEIDNDDDDLIVLNVKEKQTSNKS